MKKNIPKKDILVSGHTACPGCGNALSLKFVLRAMGLDSVMVVPAGCTTIIQGMWPCSCCPEIPVFHTAFGGAAATAAGIKAGFEVEGKKTNVFVFAGDGGTFDIGMGGLSGAAERGDDIIYVCCDNEAYMNTGIQRSSSTPFGAWTTTTPKCATNTTGKKNMPRIMAAHNIPYVAVASIGHPEDLIRKIEYAKTLKGFKYIQICAPCTSGWKFSSDLTIEMAKLAFRTGMYPLYEIFDGERYVTNYPKEGKKLIPVSEYLSQQGRFKHLSEQQIVEIQEQVNLDMAKLYRREKESVC